MEGFLNYIIDKYLLFLTISIVLVFALIGYFVDMRRKKNDPFHVEKKDDISLENIAVSNNVALGDALSQNAGINTSIDTASSTVTMASQAMGQDDNMNGGNQL